MSRFFNFLIFISFIYADECFYNWNKSLISDSNEKILHLKGIRFSNDKSKAYYDGFEKIGLPIDLFYSKNKRIIRVDYYLKENYSDKIKYIFDIEKSMKIFDETNQLFITEADTNLIHIFSQLFNSEFLLKNSEDIKSSFQKYILKLEKYNLEINLKIKDCLKLKQIEIRNLRDTLIANNFFKINKLSIDYLDIKNYDKIFKINDNYFEYDLRK